MCGDYDLSCMGVVAKDVTYFCCVDIYTRQLYFDKTIQNVKCACVYMCVPITCNSIFLYTLHGCYAYDLLLFVLIAIISFLIPSVCKCTCSTDLPWEP